MYGPSCSSITGFQETLDAGTHYLIDGERDLNGHDVVLIT